MMPCGHFSILFVAASKNIATFPYYGHQHFKKWNYLVDFGFLILALFFVFKKRD
jgi:hypothetical protein